MTDASAHSLALALLLVGCEQPEPADYFPLAPGARRVMRVYTRLVTALF